MKEHIMYADRETGGLGRSVVVAAAKAEQVRDAEATKALDGRNRQDRQEFKEPPAPVRLPAKIAIEMASGQARRRSPKARRLSMLGAVLLLAAGAAGTFGNRWGTVGPFIAATDEAYVSAHNTTLAAKGAGYVS